MRRFKRQVPESQDINNTYLSHEQFTNHVETTLPYGTFTSDARTLEHNTHSLIPLRDPDSFHFHPHYHGHGFLVPNSAFISTLCSSSQPLLLCVTYYHSLHFLKVNCAKKIRRLRTKITSFTRLIFSRTVSCRYEALRRRF